MKKNCTKNLRMCRKDCTFAQNFCKCAMSTSQSFNEYIRQTIISNWNQNALTDYQGTDVAVSRRSPQD